MPGLLRGLLLLRLVGSVLDDDEVVLLDTVLNLVQVQAGGQHALTDVVVLPLPGCQGDVHISLGAVWDEPPAEGRHDILLQLGLLAAASEDKAQLSDELLQEGDGQLSEANPGSSFHGVEDVPLDQHHSVPLPRVLQAVGNACRGQCLHLAHPPLLVVDDGHEEPGLSLPDALGDKGKRVGAELLLLQPPHHHAIEGGAQDQATWRNQCINYMQNT
eukprot:16452374-Heterocapsa_arctica.AAC.2